MMYSSTCNQAFIPWLNVENSRIALCCKKFIAVFCKTNDFTTIDYLNNQYISVLDAIKYNCTSSNK